MKKILLIVSCAFIALTLIYSCGPSKEEIEREKQRAIDSVKASEDSKRIESENIAREEERERLEARKREREEAEEARKSNPLNFLSYQVSNQNRGAFMKDRLIVSIINTDNSRRIANVRFKVSSYSKTDLLLSTHEEIILDFINPGQTYNRMIDYDKFHSESKSYKVRFLSANFAD